MRNLKKLVILKTLLLICFSALANESFESLTSEFIEHMASKHNYDKTTLQKYFSNLKPLPEVIERITTPYEALPWGKYRDYLISSKRIDSGVEFWKDKQQILSEAEKQFGVPAEIIVAILGIESFYGQYQGKYPVMQSLATLAFGYKPRANFFRQELEEFLLLSREQNFDPLEIKGSYAGAMGSPQFISSSYRNYAIDFAKIGNNSLNNMTNSIGSIANYFRLHGWQPGKPVVHRVSAVNSGYQKLIADDYKNPKPTLSLDTIKSHGIKYSSEVDPLTKLSLIELDNHKEKELYLGTKNFYVITRYNRSTNYAMAIYQLSQAIKSKYLANS